MVNLASVSRRTKQALKAQRDAQMALEAKRALEHALLKTQQMNYYFWFSIAAVVLLICAIAVYYAWDRWSGRSQLRDQIKRFHIARVSSPPLISWVSRVRGVRRWFLNGSPTKDPPTKLTKDPPSLTEDPLCLPKKGGAAEAEKLPRRVSGALCTPNVWGGGSSDGSSDMSVISNHLYDTIDIEHDEDLIPEKEPHGRYHQMHQTRELNQQTEEEQTKEEQTPTLLLRKKQKTSTATKTTPAKPIKPTKQQMLQLQAWK